MSRTEQLLAEARRLEQLRITELNRGLGRKLGEIDQAEHDRLHAMLIDTMRQHIAALEYGLETGIMPESEYQARMTTFLNNADINDLMTALS